MKEKSPAKHLSILFQICFMALKFSPWLLPSILFLNVFSSLVPASLIWIGKMVLDQLVYVVTNEASAEKLFFLVGLELFLRVFQSFLGEITTHLNLKFSSSFEHEIRRKFLESNQAVPYEHYENTQHYDKLSIIINQVFNGATSYVNQQITWIRSFVQLASIFVLLLEVNIYFVICIFGVNFIRFSLRLFFSKKDYSLACGQAGNKRKIAYLFEMLTQPVHIKDIKLFGLGKYFSDLYLKIHKKTVRENLKLHIRQMYSFSFLEFISTGFFYAFYLYIINGVVKGVLSIGDISLYQRAYTLLDTTIGGFIQNISSLYKDNLYMEMFLDFIKKKKGTHLDKNSLTEIKEISFENVSFQYPQTSRKSLLNVNIKIKKGEMIAFVGANGSGKTTLIKLLMGLHKPTQGKVLYNQQELSTYFLESIYSRVGCLLTDFNRYHMSFKENVTVGDISRKNDEEQIDSIIKEMDLDTYLKSLPNGKETYLSKYFQDGVSPSSGQWQKIALARVLFRDPELLILDEATAHIDNQFTYDFIQKLKRWKEERKKTIVIISHELRTVSFAERIYVLDQGRVKEEGTHDFLLSEKGLYSDLWNKENY